MRSPPSGKLLKIRNSSKQLKVNHVTGSLQIKCFETNVLNLLEAESTSKAEQRKTLESVIKPESTLARLFRSGATQRLGLCNPEIVFIAHR